MQHDGVQISLLLRDAVLHRRITNVFTILSNGSNGRGPSANAQARGRSARRARLGESHAMERVGIRCASGMQEPHLSCHKFKFHLSSTAA